MRKKSVSENVVLRIYPWQFRNAVFITGGFSLAAHTLIGVLVLIEIAKFKSWIFWPVLLVVLAVLYRVLSGGIEVYEKSVTRVVLEKEGLRWLDGFGKTLDVIPKEKVKIIRLRDARLALDDVPKLQFFYLMFDELGVVKEIHGYGFSEILTKRYMLIIYRPEYEEILKNYFNVPFIDERLESEKAIQSKQAKAEVRKSAEREYQRQIAQARAIQEEIDRRQQAALQEAFLREQQSEKPSDGTIPPENGTDEENTDTP